MADFNGKVVQITGAASGFGAMAAAEFARGGAKLLLSDVNGDGLDEVARNLESLGAEVLTDAFSVADDAAMEAHVAKGIDRFGRLDIALNNAGIGGGLCRLPDIPLETYDQIMEINAKGVFIGMRHQIPAMLAQGGGSILNTASAAGLVGSGQLAAYAASKHAVIGMTKAAADEVARKGIRVNAICPSFASTPMVEAMGDIMGERHGISREEAYNAIASRVPMRRVADPMEVVQAMLWIVSDANSFMTGQAISIDGGLTAV
ncbi:glucose 1-dehydrogenase [Maritimibacter sp. UBA3975]|uniref:SDR family NAD(P)-dependent oxidoreductase n=1 Tax=Maritimibacter sp. UBA3975 TaxID=1946833 RepID=UPI000C0B40A4|nr:glucose 1-dehydrogenase [Maritimibacter sp. UBA3975]MAM62043.1 short-chain dehydrogenase [Maritimibacter sp.]|tara:strand:- start:4648 stop:5430 length:783 start_codon:yes stop_codon:yes gene_type:complete